MGEIGIIPSIADAAPASDGTGSAGVLPHLAYRLSPQSLSIIPKNGRPGPAIVRAL
jgi:hypothetical protein